MILAMKIICESCLLLFVSVIVLLIAALGIIKIYSPGKPTPYLDSRGINLENSISEKGRFEVNGVELHYFIKGKSKFNPVLLYLHGGMPDYFLTEKYPSRLDEFFTVVWLDQRGAGLSYKARYPDKVPVIDVLISDIKEVTNLLQKRFSQEKIYLMGHSGGTFLGVKVVEKHPELFRAYIGVAQISYQKKSEKKASEFMRTQYGKNPKRKKMYDALVENPVELDKPIPEEYLKMRDRAMHELGIGTMKNMTDVVTGVFIPSLLFKEYSLTDKLHLWKGKANSGISKIWDEIIDHDLTIEDTSFEIPIYFFHGTHDLTCSYELAKEYHEKIKAPKKAFFSFKNSAHSPIFEEPEECIRVIKTHIIEGR